MPTSKLQTLLEKAGVKTGDRISVLKENKKYEGVLMPKTDAGDPNCIIIKLDSGYNIGLVPEKIDLISSGIKKIEKEEIKAFAGFLELIEQLKNKNFLIALASNRNEAFLHLIL